jgi:hypothetical protein
MNILILGGNNHLTNSFIDKLLTLKFNFKVVVYDNNESLDNNRKNMFCDVDKYFGYLVNDEYIKVYGDIFERDKILETCQKFNINYIINNIKYNPWKSKFDNIRILSRVIENIRYCCDNHEIMRIIMMNRFFSNDYHLLTKMKNIKKHSIEYGKLQVELIMLYELNSITKYIDYTDYVIGNDQYSKNLLFESYINMFKIQTRPYTYDIFQTFNHIDKIIATMIMFLIYERKSELRNTIKGYRMNITTELIPTMISIICETRQDINQKSLNYYSETNQNINKMKLCSEDYIVKSLEYSVNKIYS